MRSVITGNKVRLRDKRLSDARNDYIWQTDPELAGLDATPVLPVSFPQYLADYAVHLRYPNPERYSFAVETIEGTHIGNCTCYDIEKVRGEAQLGIILGDRNYWGKGYGTDAMIALVDYVFTHQDLTRVYLKTLEWNVRAQNSFKKCGFTPCGRLDQDGYTFLAMELYRRQWEQRRPEKAFTQDPRD